MFVRWMDNDALSKAALVSALVLVGLGSVIAGAEKATGTSEQASASVAADVLDDPQFAAIVASVRAKALAWWVMLGLLAVLVTSLFWITLKLMRQRQGDEKFEVAFFCVLLIGGLLTAVLCVVACFQLPAALYPEATAYFKLVGGGGCE